LIFFVLVLLFSPPLLFVLRNRYVRSFPSSRTGRSMVSLVSAVLFSFIQTVKPIHCFCQCCRFAPRRSTARPMQVLPSPPSSLRHRRAAFAGVVQLRRRFSTASAGLFLCIFVSVSVLSPPVFSSLMYAVVSLTRDLFSECTSLLGRYALPRSCPFRASPWAPLSFTRVPFTRETVVPRFPNSS